MASSTTTANAASPSECLSLPKACPRAFQLILPCRTSPRAAACGAYTDLWIPVLHPWLGPAAMHSACEDVMLSPPDPSAILQPTPCTQHHSPTSSWREMSTSSTPSILTHPTGAFPPPGIEKLSPCFSSLKAWNWGVKPAMLRAAEILSHKHLLCRTQSSPGL